VPSAPATVSLTVTDQAPVANNNSYTVGKGKTLTVAAAGVLANDTDADGDTLTAALASGPANGTLTLNANGSLTYTPNAGFVGSDSFTYTARDGALASTPATVSVTVTNQAPAAANDAYQTGMGNTLTVAAAGVLANDTDADGDALTAVLATSPTNGTLTLNANGSFTYTPNAGFSGTDSFTYTAGDGTVASSPATVSVNVTNTNGAPVAVNDTYNTGKGTTLTVPAAGVLVNDTDADGDALTAVLVSNPANGTLTLNANGSFTYVPNAGFSGTDSFTYKANDGAVDSAAATVNITVAAQPSVKSIVFNDGSAQRSLIRSITITFDTLVTLDSGAFSLTRAGGGSPSKARQVTNENGETKVVLTFSGYGSNYGSLTDGNWTLRILKGRVHRADDRSVMSADHVTTFHRFFGDWDGDRDVDAADQTAFNAAFGQTDGASLSTFDFRRDGDVDATDRNQFNKRFGRTI